MSHVPLLFVPECEPHGTLIGHMARANPHWRNAARAESVAIFHGPHAYVSPSWFAEPSKGVPTWNYAVVHASGTLDVIDDPVETRRVLDALVHRFEADRAAPWQFAMAERQRDALVGAIVAFRIRIRRLTGKFKLSQNRPRRRSDADRRGARQRAVCGCRRRRRVDAHVRRRRGREMTRRSAEPGTSRADRASTSGCGRRASIGRAASRQQAIDAGQVRVDGERVKPAHAMRAGDARQRPQAGADVERCDVARRRRSGAARRPQAAALYRETADSARCARRRARAEGSRARRRSRARAGRPTKRDRRRLEDFLNEP